MFLSPIGVRDSNEADTWANREDLSVFTAAYLG